MPWRIDVDFPKHEDDDARAFTHRVGNLQEEIAAELRSRGGGSISWEGLDRVGYLFSVEVPKKRDLASVMRLVERAAATHIPERLPAVISIKA